LLPALHPGPSLSREDIIIFAVTAPALEIKSGPHPVTWLERERPDPTRKDHCYVAWPAKKLYGTKRKMNRK
jgi:hypothetical protein